MVTEVARRVVGGRYEIERPIGSGGMAEVFLAQDRRLDRPVALKLLGPAFASDPELVERFRREAQAAAGLNHPNVVAIYDWGQDGDSYYLVMEYVAGENLKEVVRRTGPLPEAQALGIGADVAAALEAAHARGIVHRDVKPHNVMLDGRGRVKVADFGIAQASGSATLTAAGAGVFGTAHYLSPEQARGQRVDARSDLYSLGALLFELLTGRTPYTGDSPLSVALQHVNAPVPSLSAHRADVSPATEALVARAMAKSPAERYQSAADMRAAIGRARATPDDPTAVGPPPIGAARPIAGVAPVAASRPTPSSVADWTIAEPRATWLDRWPLLLAGLGLALLLGWAAVRARATGTPQPTTTATTAITGATATTAPLLTATTAPLLTATAPPLLTATAPPPPTVTPPAPAPTATVVAQPGLLRKVEPAPRPPSAAAVPPAPAARPAAIAPGRSGREQSGQGNGRQSDG